MKNRLSAEYIILGSLMSGPRHGYEILQFIKSNLGSTWQVSSSQLYLLLKRLEKKGRLQSKIKAQETRPSKRVFSLSAEGKGDFQNWLRAPNENVRDLRFEFLVKLFFFSHLSLSGGEELVHAQIHVLKQRKKQLAKQPGSRNDAYGILVYDLKKSTIDTWIKWLNNKALPFIIKAGNSS